MPRYVFILHDGEVTAPDFARDLPDLRAARREAVRALAELARDELPDDGDQMAMWISVQDERGEELLTASLTFEVRRPDDAKRGAAPP
jgi:hypothetical protein